MSAVRAWLLRGLLGAAVGVPAAFGIALLTGGPASAASTVTIGTATVDCTTTAGVIDITADTASATSVVITGTGTVSIDGTAVGSSCTGPYTEIESTTSPAVPVQFTTDGSIPTLVGVGTSTLTFSGATSPDPLVLAPSAAGTGAATYGGATTTYSGIAGTITGAGSTDTVTVPSPGTGNTAYVTPTSVAVGTSSPGTTWAALSGFTVFDGASATGTLAFSTDGTANITFAGNGTDSSLTTSGSGTLALGATAGSGSFTGSGTGTPVTSFSAIGGTITGTSAEPVHLPSTGPVAVSATSTGVTVTPPTASTSPAITTDTLSGYTTFDAEGSAATSFSTDGTATGLTFTGNGTTSSLAIDPATGNAGDAVTVAVASAPTSDSTVTFGLATPTTTTYSDVLGPISTTATGSNTFTLPAPGAGTTVAFATTGGTTSVAYSGTTLADFGAGFTGFTAPAGFTTTFSTDGTEVVTFTGNGTDSSLTTSGSGTLTLGATAGSGSFTGSGTGTPVTSFSAIGGTITGTSAEPVHLPSTGPVAVSATPTGVTVTPPTASATTPAITSDALSGYTTFDAEGSAATSFTTDGTAAVTFTGNGTTSTLTVSGSGTLTLDATAGSGNFAGTATTSFTDVTGGIAGASSNTVTADLPSSGTVGVDATSTGVTVTPGTGSETLTNLATFDAEGSAATSFTTDGTAAVTFTGNGPSSILAIDPSTTGETVGIALADSTSTVSDVSIDGTPNVFKFSDITGDITTNGAGTVTLPAAPAGTLSVATATSTTYPPAVTTVEDGTTLLGTFGTGFMVFDGSGVTGTIDFTTDGSEAVTFTGNDAAGTTTSALAFSGPGALDLAPNAVDAGTASFGGNTTTYSGIGGTITGGSGTNTVTVPSPGTGSTTYVTPTSIAVGTSSPGTTWATLSGFTVFDASGATGTIVFSANDTASVTFTGNGDATGDSSSLTFAGSGAVALSPSAAGAGSATAGTATVHYSGIYGTITGGSGTNTVDLTDGSTSTALSVTVGGGAVTVTPAVDATLVGFTGYDASTWVGTVTFTTDGSVSGLTFTGNGPSSILAIDPSTTGETVGIALADSTSTVSDVSIDGTPNVFKFSDITGDITTNGAGTVTLPAAPAGTLSVAAAASTTYPPVVTTVEDGTTLLGTFGAGFSSFDGSGVTGTIDFSTDGTATGLTFTGNGTTSSLAIDPATGNAGDAVTVAVASAPTSDSTVTFGLATPTTTTYSDVLGPISTTATGSNTFTLPAPGAGTTVAFATTGGTTSVAYSGTTLADFGAGFTGFTAPAGFTTTFSTDGTEVVTFTGNGTDSSLTTSGSGTLTLGATAGSGSFTGSGTGTPVTSFSAIGGTITGTSAEPVHLPSTGPVAVSATPTGVTVTPPTASATTPAITSDALSGYTTFDAEGSAATSFTTDGTAAVTFTGNGTTSTLAIDPSATSDPVTVALSDAPTSTTPAGESTGAISGTDVVTFTDILGTISTTSTARITGTSTSAETITLPSPTGTLAVTTASSVTTVEDGTTLLGTFGTGFMVFDGSGVTGTIVFTDDGSSIGQLLVGNGTTSTLDVAAPLSTDTVGIGFAASPTSPAQVTTNGSDVFSFEDITKTIVTNGIGEIVLPSGTDTLSVVTSGGSTTVTDVTTGTGYGAFGGNFTVFVAATTSGPVEFASDGSVATTYTGNGASSSIAFATVASGQPGLIFCLGATSTVELTGAPCSSSSTDVVTFGEIGSVTGSPNNDTFVVEGWSLPAMTLNAGCTGYGSGAGACGSDTLDLAASTAALSGSNAFDMNATSHTTSVTAGGSTFTVTSSYVSNLDAPDATGNRVTVSTSQPGILVGGSAGGNDFVFDAGSSGAVTIVDGGTGSENTIDFSAITSASVSLDLLDGGFQATGGAGMLLVVPGTVTKVVAGGDGGTIVIGLGTSSSSPGSITGNGTTSETLDGGAGYVNVTAPATSGNFTLIGGAQGGSLNGGTNTGQTTYVPGGGTFTITASTQTGATSILDLANEPAAVDVNLSAGTVNLDLPGGGKLASFGAGGVLGGWIGAGGSGRITNPAAFLKIGGSQYADVIVANDVADTTTTITSPGPAIVYSGTGSENIACTNSDCTVDYQLVPLGSPPYSGATDLGICVNLSASSIGTGDAIDCKEPSGTSLTVSSDQAYKFGTNTYDTLGGVDEVVGTTGGADVLVAGNSGQTLVAGAKALTTMYGSAAGHDTLDAQSSASGSTVWAGPEVPTSEYAAVAGGGVDASPYGAVSNVVSGAGYDTIVVGVDTTVSAQLLNTAAANPEQWSATPAYDTIESSGSIAANFDFIYGDPSDTVEIAGAVVPPTQTGPDGYQANEEWIVNDGGYVSDVTVAQVLG